MENQRVPELSGRPHIAAGNKRNLEMETRELPPGEGKSNHKATHAGAYQRRWCQCGRTGITRKLIYLGWDESD